MPQMRDLPQAALGMPKRYARLRCGRATVWRTGNSFSGLFEQREFVICGHAAWQLTPRSSSEVFARLLGRHTGLNPGRLIFIGGGELRHRVCHVSIGKIRGQLTQMRRLTAQCRSILVSTKGLT